MLPTGYVTACPFSLCFVDNQSPLFFFGGTETWNFPKFMAQKRQLSTVILTEAVSHPIRFFPRILVSFTYQG